MGASVRPLIHIHDFLDQQAEALELREVQVFHRLIEAAVDPFAIAFLKDGEVLVKCLAPNAINDSILMQELSGLKLQTHRSALINSQILACRGDDHSTEPLPLALDQLKAFLVKMQNDEGLKETVLAASTADDVARIALGLGFEFSGDELLRFSGKKVGRVTVSKQDHPGEYH